VAPELAELLDRVRQGARARREEGRVDGAGGNAGDDLESQVRHPAREGPQDADLVGGAGPAPAEDEGDLAVGSDARSVAMILPLWQ
jgi:hypothetical protein